MKIVKLQAENVKRLVAVEITPTGNLVQITGKNGAGKTSVLDAIWWALAGKGNIQAAPIRKGQNKARIRLDLGEIIVTRTFAAKEEGEPTTTIAVENADGARFPSPQAMLDSLLGQLSFDPLAFARMKPREQFDALRRFVPEVDFEAIENAQRGDYQRRQEINRDEKQARAAAQIIVVPPETPDAPVDVSALAAELEEVGKFNAELETRKARRQRAQEELAAKRAVVRQMQGEADALRARADEIIAKAGNINDEADELEQKLGDAEPLPAPKDTVVLRGRIDGAQALNRQVTEKQRRKQLFEQADNLKAQADEISARMAAREADKEAKIAAAQIPVPGLTFGDGIVLLDGQPFEQGSDAQQLRASVAIAMASNPKLRVVRIRDGSLLDAEGLELIAKAAEANDMQVWIERVDDSGKIGFYIEDGTLKATEAAAAPAV